MNNICVDLDLVRKYDIAGPRYTSYPPATRFLEELPFEALFEQVDCAAETDLSLYFHIPFCQSLCWFCGCTTVITTQQSQSAAYLNYLQKELALIAPRMNRNRKVVQLHFGGGTPTFLLPDEIRKLGQWIRSSFALAPNVEAGVELDPRRLTREHVKALRDAGFNRASLGVQDHNPIVQRAVHRSQPFALTKTAVDWIYSAGFTSLNIDLIYGLPRQTLSSFEKTLDEVLYLKPGRLAVFSYAHVPWLKPAQRILTASALPSAEVKLELLKLTIEKLTSSGYVYIGMDHFAREDDALAVAQRRQTLQRNFQGYSTHGDADLLGLGLSSISKVDGVYWQNQKTLPEYYEELDRHCLPIHRGYVLSDEDKIRRHIIMQLMCGAQLDFAELSQKLEINFAQYFEAELSHLDDLEEDGLIERTAHSLVITQLGRLFLRNIAMRFDAYLAVAKQEQFSRAI